MNQTVKILRQNNSLLYVKLNRVLTALRGLQSEICDFIIDNLTIGIAEIISEHSAVLPRPCFDANEQKLSREESSFHFEEQLPLPQPRMK